MKKSSAIKLAIVLLLTVAFGFIATNGLSLGMVRIKPVASAIKQGLDLRGGVYTIYQAKDTTQADLEEKINGAREVLANRLVESGYTESTIVVQGTDRIRIEIPDVKDPAAILDIIGTPAKLEFIDPDNNVVLEGKDIKKAQAALGEGNAPVVAFELNDSGTKAFSDATEKYMGKAIRIVLDGETISAPTVQSRIPDGKGQITQIGSTTEAKQLAMLIQSGALPLELEQIEVRSISATLGEKALSNSLMAGIIGIALVFLFMIIFYRLPGLIADISLCIYMVIMAYLLAVIPYVQLTLPGIAGIVLSIGMAVDANVIIFERIKEELRLGKTLRASVNAGFSRAFSAIIDSNITTIIAAVVLLIYGTGTIKSFAVTLLIGVLTSMFTAIVVTRQLLRWAADLKLTQKALYGVKESQIGAPARKPFQFVKNFKRLVIISVVIIAVGLGYGIGFGGFNWGIDFTGGTIMTVDMGKDFAEADVQAALSSLGIDEAQINLAGEGNQKTTAIIRTRALDSQRQEQINSDLIRSLKEEYPDVSLVSSDSVGGVVGVELTSNALASIAIACGLILIYIAFRFEFFSGVSAVLMLLHDVAIMFAIVALIRLPLNSSFVAAILTVVGYSINATIVVFDRVRENMKKYEGQKDKDRAFIVDTSIQETLGRSINTTITTLLTIGALYVMGVESIREFALPIIIGLFSGVFSSVFLASPLWCLLKNAQDKRKADQKVAARTGKARS